MNSFLVILGYSKGRISARKEENDQNDPLILEINKGIKMFFIKVN